MTDLLKRYFKQVLFLSIQLADLVGRGWAPLSPCIKFSRFHDFLSGDGGWQNTGVCHSVDGVGWGGGSEDGKSSVCVSHLLCCQTPQKSINFLADML